MPKPFAARALPVLGIVCYVLAVTVGVFAGGLWAALGIGTSLLAFLVLWASSGNFPAPDKSILLFMALTFAVMATLNLQSAFPAVSWQILLQLTTIFIPLAFFSSKAVQEKIDTPALFPILAIAVLVGGLAVGLELYLGGPLLHAVQPYHIKGIHAYITQYNRGVSYLVILAMPVLAWLWVSGRRGLALCFAVLMLVPVSLTEARAAKAAFMFGFAIICLATFLPKIARALLTFILFASLLMPFAAQYVFLHHHEWLDRIPPSWKARAEIWDYMSYRIFERPWFGWGLGSSYLVPWQQPHGSLYQFTDKSAGHTHNVTLQLWVELGVPGIVLGFAFALGVLQRMSKLPSALIPFAYGAWMATFSVCSVAYSFWDDSQFCAMALTALAFALLKRKLTEVPLLRQNLAVQG